MRSFNLAVVVGRLSRPAAARRLPSGDRLVSFEVTMRGSDGQRTESVPVVWLGAPAAAEVLDTGEAVVVAGRVRRRFFRLGGHTQSRTELVADAVVPYDRQARAARLLRGAANRLQAEAASLS